MQRPTEQQVKLFVLGAGDLLQERTNVDNEDFLDEEGEVDYDLATEHSEVTSELAHSLLELEAGRDPGERGWEQLEEELFETLDLDFVLRRGQESLNQDSSYDPLEEWR